MMETQKIVTNFEVQAFPRFVPEQSSVAEARFVFSYSIKITNKGTETAQLINRHWIITDAFGRTEEVRGPGVVGKQPDIAPGESFEYTSFCPLSTPTGSMKGSYQMVLRSGLKFEVQIPQFYLIEPNSFH